MSPAPLLERDVTTQVTDFLKLRGWRLVRMNVTLVPLRGHWVKFGEAGMPDFLALRYRPESHAQVLWLEFKRSKRARTSEVQLAWHESERRRGGMVVTVYDYDSFSKFYTTTFER